MRDAFYVDSPKERASVFILNQLGITTTSFDSYQSEFFAALAWSKDELSREHKSESKIFIRIIKGIGSLELRDTSNSWISVTLEVGDFVSIPGQVYRKIIFDGPHTLELYCEEQSLAKYVGRFTEDRDSIEQNKYHSYRELVCELCRQFFNAGWVTGTGGSISIKYGSRIYMTPSGVQKERINPDELFVLDVAGNILSTPNRKPDFFCPKLSDCAPLFLHAYNIRNAGAVLHSHAFSTNLITSIFDGKSEFRISHQEMIKGISGHGYFDELVVPIIENTAWEHELADSLGAIISQYPKSFAVLVRRHGMYVWGRTWEEAKRHGECLHYLFDVAINMKKLALDFTKPPLLPVIQDSSHLLTLAANSKHVVFDIEGTVSPISFVKDVLFPYCTSNVNNYLDTTWTSDQTQGDVLELWKQYDIDLQSSTYNGPKVDKTSKDKSELINSLSEYVKWNVLHDRKVSSLKQLQGHMWEIGYREGKIQSIIFDDVPTAFEQLKKNDKQISIYSSGSRAAQSLLFRYSNQGDLRKFISVYFDTKVGHKRERTSYEEIIQYLGVDKPNEILFVTDIYEEATAASSAGLEVLISVRAGNSSLPEDSKFNTVYKF